MKADLSNRLQIIMERLKEHIEVSITYFQPDSRKKGGVYVTISGTVKKIDQDKRFALMTDGTEILIDEIINIEGNIFENIYDE